MAQPVLRSMARWGGGEVCVLGQGGGESMLGHGRVPPPPLLVCCGKLVCWFAVAGPGTEDPLDGGARGLDAVLRVH